MKLFTKPDIPLWISSQEGNGLAPNGVAPMRHRIQVLEQYKMPYIANGSKVD